MTHRRLKLLNEVLPAPPPAAGTNGDPRQRTLKRLGRLVAAATTVAAVSNCHGGDGGGYGVVDPMPPPPQCDGLAKSIHAEARFLSPTVLLVTLGPSSMRGAAYDPSALQVGQLRVLRRQIEANRVEIELEITGAPNYVSFQVGASCPNGPESVAVAVQAAKEGDKVSSDVPLKVTVGDSWPIEHAEPASGDAGVDAASETEADGGQFATPPPGTE
jgi:hypothetical protein